MNIVENLMKKYGELLGRLDWISGLSPESCPGGLPASDREWRDLVNRIEAETARRSDSSDLPDKSDVRPLLDPYGIATATPETAANTLICLVHQATYLLRRQLKHLERTFLDEGGFTERLYRQRRGRRG